MRKILVLLVLLISVYALFANVTVGNGVLVSQNLPIEPYFGYSYSQVIYSQSNIQGSGVITAIKYPYTISSTNFITKNSDITVYMGTTQNTSFASTTSWIPVNQLTQVYTGSITEANFSSALPGTGWLTITLTTPFTYNNAQNLVVAVDENAAGFSSNSDEFYCTTAPTGTAIDYHNDNTNPDPANPPTGNLHAAYPNITLVGINATTPPAIPTSPIPADAATGVITHPTLSWTSNADTYSVYFGQTGSTLNQVATNLTSNSYPITTNLSFNTSYSWYVVASNAVGNVTSPTWSFTVIPDSAQVLPYTQDFSNGIPPLNWKRYSGLLGQTTTMTTTTSGWTEDDFANNETTTASPSARLNIWSTSTKYWLVSPTLILPQGSTNVVEFDLAYTKYSTTEADTLGVDDKFAVVVSTDDGVTWSSDNILRLWTNTTPISNIGEHVVLPLTGITGRIKIGFYGESTVSNKDNNVYIDNFTARVQPTNPLFAINPSSVDFGNIVLGNTATQQMTIQNQGSGTLTITSALNLQGTNANQFSITDTNVYPLIIQANQTVTLQVAFTPTTAGTKTATLHVVDNLTRQMHDVPITGVGFDANIYPPYTQDFSGTFPPVSWGRYSGILSEQSELTPTTSGWAVDDFSNNSTLANPSARVEIWTTSVKYWLVTTPIALGTTPGQYRLEFDLALTNWNSQSPDSLRSDDKFAVVISTDNGQTWSSNNVLRQWNNTTPISSTGEHIIIPLANYSGNVKVAFYGESTVSGGDVNVYVDNFAVAAMPTAPLFNVSTDTLDYGSVVINTTHTQSIMVSNYGVGNLILTQPFGFTGADAVCFSLVDAPTFPVTIPSNQTRVFTVKYLPTTVGNKSAIMTITDNLTRQAHTIQLLGSCYDPSINPPYTQDFSGTTFPPENWERYSGILAPVSALTTTTSGWLADDFCNITEPVNRCTKVNIYGTSVNYWLATPFVNLGSTLGQYRLEFDLALTHWNNSTATTLGVDDKFAVVISTDGGATWSSENVLRQWGADNPISNSANHIIIPLSSYSGVVRIAFYAESTVSNIDNDLFIDNFEISPISTVPEISYTSDSLSFGRVGVGANTQSLFSIMNIGVGSIQIPNAITFTGTNANEFSIVETLTYPLTITSANPVSFHIQFMPTAEGTRTAIMHFVDNLSRTPHDIQLSGTAYVSDNNDVPTSATALTLPVIASPYSIDPTGDIDWYKFYLVAGDSLNIYTERINESQLDPEMYLYGPCAQDGSDVDPTNYLEDNDDGHGSLQPEINYTTTEVGWYFIRIAHYSNDPDDSRLRARKTSTREVTGEYALTINTGQNVSLYPPTNLAETHQGNIVTLTWEAPAAMRNAVSLSKSKKTVNREFLGYNIYRNETILNTSLLTALTYIDTISTNGTYSYYATAVYTEGESSPSNAVSVDILLLNPPRELTYHLNYPTNVVLNWLAPLPTRSNTVKTIETDRSLIGYKVYRNNTPIATINSSTRTYTDSNIQIGQTYNYYVVALYTEGVSMASNTVTVNINANEDPTDVVTATTLKSNYPNPFNPTTTIAYSVLERSFTTIEVFNSKGQKVRTLLNQIMDAGNHTITWNGTDDRNMTVTSGVYMLRMTSNNYSSVRKMILMK